MLPPLRPIADRKVRFAVVGCGRVSARHFAAIRQHADRAELVGLCDIDPAALDRAQTETGAPGYRSLGGLVASTDADIVVLATPSGLHCAQAVEVAESRRHVMTEKPMATSWHDGQRMVAACDTAGVRLFVVKQNRFNPTLRLLKRAIEQGRFGRIHLVTINVFCSGTRELDGGALINHASHYADLMDWLIGPVASVQAYTAQPGRDFEAEDSGVLSVRWRSGTVGSMNVAMLAQAQNVEGSITVVGESGIVRIGGAAVNDVQQWQFAEPSADDEEARKVSYPVTSVYGLGHPLYYDNVIDVLRGQAEPATDGREGLKSLEVLMAAYRSAFDGCRIELPLEN